MKKIIVIVMVLAAIALSALGFAACDGHTHTLERRAAVAASCEREGNKEYWFCTECEKYFSDEEGKQEISSAEVILPVLGHDLQDVTAYDPTCTEAGSSAGQKCSRCDYTTVQTRPAPGHDMTHHAEVPATCTEDGTMEYWTCSREEDVYYANVEGTVILEDLTITAKGHDMKYVDELDATCTEDGHLAHWVCAHEAGVYYADEQGTVTIDDVVRPAIGHAWQEQWTSDGTYHWYICDNGCGMEGSKAEHNWDDGQVTVNPTTKTEGEKLYTCEDCQRTRTEIMPMLNSYDLTVSEIDIFNNEDGGEVYIETDIPLEEGSYLEGTVVTVRITPKDNFGIGAIRVNDTLIDDSPLIYNGEYTFSFVIKEDTTLTVEFGKLVTAKHTWKLYDNGVVGYPWELYTSDAAHKYFDDEGKEKTEYGTAMLLAFDATGIGDVRAHDFTADTVFLSYKLDGTVSWSNINKQIKSTWVAMMRQLPEEERQFDLTLAFAIRLLPSAGKREIGYVASTLVLPVATTSGGVDYDMTMEYKYSKADLAATSVAQLRFTEKGDFFEFLRVDGNGSVFNTYHASYIEIEMSKDGESYYAYLFAEGNKLYMYSNLDKSGTSLACDTVTNGYIETGKFNNWVAVEYPEAWINATLGWEFRTRVHVDENSLWCYDGEWSAPVKYKSISFDTTPSFEQFNFTANGDYFEFTRKGGSGKVFTEYHAAYIEIEIKKGDTIYYAYLFDVDGEAYLYANSNKEGERQHCYGTNNAYVTTSDFNKWASKVFEDNFKALEWEYRTKVHVDENSAWNEDGEWSDVIKYIG